MGRFDAEEVRACLDEIEAELFRAADNEDCARFHRDTQLTTVVLLSLRMSSLVRPLLLLLRSEDFDGFDAVLRAFEETWYLAFEFRLNDRRERALAWLGGKKDTWKAKFGVLVEFTKGRGHPSPIMGRDYGLLSELAHPTRSAAENSVTLCGVRQKIDAAEAEITEARANDAERIRYSLYRLVWLVLDHDAKFIKLPITEANLARCEKFVDTYDRVEPDTAPPQKPEG